MVQVEKSGDEAAGTFWTVLFDANAHQVPSGLWMMVGSAKGCGITGLDVNERLVLGLGRYRADTESEEARSKNVMMERSMVKLELDRWASDPMGGETTMIAR